MAGCRVATAGGARIAACGGLAVPVAADCEVTGSVRLRQGFGGRHAKRALWGRVLHGGGRGIRTPGTLRYTRFPSEHNRPLCHPSEWVGGPTGPPTHSP